jgi:hypothetical protein
MPYETSHQRKGIVNMFPSAKLVKAKFVSSFRRHKGFVGILKSCSEEIEDIWFDRKFGVDTLETTSDWALPAVPFGIPYQPTKIRRLKRVLSELSLRYQDFIFLDIGSGKGRALLMASEFPFRRIIGVEFLPELHSIAQKNVQTYRSTTQKCSAIDLHCCDATVYRMPTENTVLFLANPFEHPIVSRLLINVRESLQNHPREVYVVYSNPVCHDLIIRSEFMEVVRMNELFAIYKNKMSLHPSEPLT